MTSLFKFLAVFEKKERNGLTDEHELNFLKEKEEENQSSPNLKS